MGGPSHWLAGWLGVYPPHPLSHGKICPAGARPPKQKTWGVRPPIALGWYTATSDVSVVTWQWTFGDGQGSNEQNPIHLYSTAGDFTATLIATGPGGASNPVEVSVTVLLPVFLRGDSNGDGGLDGWGCH